MKRCGKRLAFTAAAAAVAVLIGLLSVLQRRASQDDIAARQLLESQAAETIAPDPLLKGQRAGLDAWGRHRKVWLDDVLRLIANYSGRPVVFDKGTDPGVRSETAPWQTIENVTADMAMAALKANGWRIVAQFQPRATFVLLKDSPTARWDIVWDRAGIPEAGTEEQPEEDDLRTLLKELDTEEPKNPGR